MKGKGGLGPFFCEIASKRPHSPAMAHLFMKSPPLFHGISHKSIIHMDKKAWITLGATLVVVVIGTIAANIISAKVPAIGKLQTPSAKA